MLPLVSTSCISAYGQDRVRLAVIASFAKRGLPERGGGRGRGRVGESTSERGLSFPLPHARSPRPWNNSLLALPSLAHACASKPAVLEGRVAGPAKAGNNSVNNGQVKAKRIPEIGAEGLLSPSRPDV